MKRDKGLYSLMKDCERYRRQDRHNRSMSLKRRCNCKDKKEREDAGRPSLRRRSSRDEDIESGFFDEEGTISFSYRPLRYRYDRKDVEEYVDDLEYYVEPFEEETDKNDKTDQPPETILEKKEPDQPKTKEDDTEDAIIINDPNPPHPSPFPPKPERMPITTDEVKQETIPMSVDDTFEADLKSILSGQKTYDASQKKMVPSTGSRTPKKARRRPVEEDEPMKNEHKIFDKIAQSMEMATAYDLGAISLDRRFEAFEQEMDEKQELKKKIEQQLPARSLDTTDFLSDLDKINQQAEVARSFSNDIPLTPLTGGQSIGKDALETGDIILSTTDDPNISGTIRKITRSEISHAAIYIGEGKVIEAVESGVLERSLETAMADDSVTVAFRHQNMTPEKAAKIRDFLIQKRKDKVKFDQYAVVRNLPIQIITSVCSALSPDLRDRCRNFAGRIFLGTESNNEFYCSELVFAAFEHAGLKLSNTNPHWTSAEDLVQLNYNGTLRYVGHLKTT